MPFINGIGAPELIIILIIALIVVGPGRLPDVGSALGKSIREFRKAATDVSEATSLDPAPSAQGPHAPAPAGSAPAAPAAPVVPAPAAASPAIPAATTALPATAADAAADTGAAPDIAELPEPAPVADEQRTPTA
jgi:TatA/E family protein of Tat protein translocase